MATMASVLMRAVRDASYAAVAASRAARSGPASSGRASRAAAAAASRAARSGPASSGRASRAAAAAAAASRAARSAAAAASHAARLGFGDGGDASRPCKPWLRHRRKGRHVVTGGEIGKPLPCDPVPGKDLDKDLESDEAALESVPDPET
ncbi:hypothetical protein ACP70R_009662 [Stipagrostis hirtigluma subsp. patula]